MANEPYQEINSTSGGDNDASEARPQSIREVAEAAYDDVSSTEPSDEGSPDRGDGRDRRGRFAPKEQAQEPGEQRREPSSPDKPEAQARTDPAPAGSSNQPPEHWSAEDKQMFQRLPQDARSFLTRRYTEMEADYTRKSQASAGAVQAVQALSPIFQDPDISRSLEESGIDPIEAVHDWGRLHKLAVSANPRDRAGVLYELAQRMGFDPAKLFASSRQPTVQLTPEQQKDPAIQYFADLQSKAQSDLQALRAELQQFKSSENQRIEQEAVRVTKTSIDAFADEKSPDGRPVRPYFDRVVARIIDAFKVNPDRDLQQTYDEACWADPEIRKELIQAETAKVNQRGANERARMAVRGNTRGLTSPVSKPNPQQKSNGSLRDIMEASAEEVGF